VNIAYLWDANEAERVEKLGNRLFHRVKKAMDLDWGISPQQNSRNIRTSSKKSGRN
jgi:hypothetical protein